MAVVLVQNGVHSWPKSHFMHDEVGNLSEKQLAGFTALVLMSRVSQYK